MQKEQVLLCYHCGNKTLMKRISEYGINISFEIDCVKKEWELYLCPVCNETTLIYTKQSWFEWESIDMAEKDTKTVYPVSSQESTQMPENVKNAFEAATKVRNIDGAICALALRRTLEMMCKDQGETDDDLYKKLENLSKKNIMPPILNEMATILRRLGNAAAHADEADFPNEVVISMIDFTRTILDYVYVLPDKLQSIQKKLSKEVASTDSNSVKVEKGAVVTKED